jgi:hypothetical protein
MKVVRPGWNVNSWARTAWRAHRKTRKPLSWWAPLYNGLRLSCGLPAPQPKKMASIGPSDRGGASGPTA